MTTYKFDTHQKLLIKGDASGIQQFIFNIKSKKASQTLKAKSFYVQVVGEMLLQSIYNQFGINNRNAVEIYNGGGNFFILLPDTDENKHKLDAIKAKVIKELADDSIFFVLSYISYDETLNYPQNLELINRQSQKDSLNRFLFLESLEDFSSAGLTNASNAKWGDLSKKMRGNSSYNFTNVTEPDSLTKFDLSLIFTNAGNSSVNWILPKWNSQLLYEFKEYLAKIQKESAFEDDEAPLPERLITFNQLGILAEMRTGTDNLGILKLDIDNLGSLIKKQNTPEDNKNFSEKLSFFFEHKLKELLRKDFTYVRQGNGPVNKKFELVKSKAKFSENIYLIFSGGDDCFLVGAWDAVIEFASLFKHRFDEYINSEFRDENISFSAGLVLIHANYPVNKFAELAEEALTKAKAVPGKNAVCLFNHVVGWDEWFEIQGIAKGLREIILKYNVARSIIGRFRKNLDFYDALEKKATLKNTQFDYTTITELFYIVRDLSVKISESISGEALSDQRELKKDIIDVYQKYLKRILENNETVLALIFPLSARIAEFFTKSKN